MGEDAKIMPFCVKYPYVIAKERTHMSQRANRLIPLDVCAAAAGVSFLDALAQAQDEDYEYLIFMGKIYEVTTGTEAISIR